MTDMMAEAVESQFLNTEQIERWPAGKTLFQEGEEPRGIYFIHAGEVDLVFSARNGNSRTLRVSHPGDAVGLSDAIANSPHDCTATTRTAARIGFVPLSELRQMLNDSPALWFRILQFLSQDINACWDSMRTISAR
ncbi:MAG TPA: Crp/Fnr family transcriptional regulator [Thermoanaerobaculia bacterium]|nr:Crp/Fnr family transcriptional regulator [Thermoanaerobaculia bacterium]